MAYKEYVPQKLYYTIGEVAEILNESTSLVRFWTDSFSSYVRPERNAKGDRKYTPKDIDALKVIHYLVKDRKMTLQGAKEYLKSNPEGIDRRAEVAQRLRGIKEMLLEISDNLEYESI